MIVEKLLVKKLKELGYHITFAESCTGGLCAATLVNVSGASAVFNGSYVTYANEEKIRLLKVNKLDIERQGVVSEEVAKQMAVGVQNSFGSEIGVGISGIAGPLGGTKEKPVGTVCFGFSILDQTFSCTMHFKHKTRCGIRHAAVNFVFKYLLEYFK